MLWMLKPFELQLLSSQVVIRKHIASQLTSRSMAMNIISRETPTPGPNRDSEIYPVIGVFLVLAAIALGLRFASKRILRKPLRIDDYLVVWAFVSQSLPST